MLTEQYGNKLIINANNVNRLNKDWIAIQNLSELLGLGERILLTNTATVKRTR